MDWRRFFRRAYWDGDRLAEIQSYVDIETDENLACGMTPEAARSAAQRKFGNRTLVREEIYTMNTLSMLDTLGRDVRYGLRFLRQNPLYTIVALLTLAIGIGANTAVFAVLNSVLLKPLAYPNPEQLVAVWHKAPGAEGLASASGDLRLSASMYFTYAEQNRSFQALGVWTTGSASITGLAQPEEVRAVYVSDGTFETLAIPPLLGRRLAHEDQIPGAAQTVVLSHGYWQRRFGGDRSVVGRTLQVDSRPRQIVGIMPAGFQVVNADADLILPLAFNRAEVRLPGFGFQGIARLRPGVNLQQANADIARLVPVWMDSWPTIPGVNPHVYEGWRIAPSIRALKQDVVGNVGDVLWVLMGTIGVVMLIAAANVANLLLVRVEARQQELAIRTALGAGWTRIVRELLLESTLLGLLGGALGLALAYAGIRYLVAIGPGTLPRLHEISIDLPALGFALLFSLLAGLLVGLIPAFKYAGPRLSLALRSAGRTASQSRERHRARNLLVVAQVAMALMLLVSAGLMIRTFQALRHVDPGFAQPERLATVRISIPSSLVREPEKVIRVQNDMLDKLAAIPGVQSVAFTSELPMETDSHDWDVVCAEGRALGTGEIPPLRVFKGISPGVFATMGTRMIAGRDLTWNEIYGRRNGVLISENLAREFWTTPQAAIGKRISSCLPKAAFREVIGVVADVHDNGVQEKAPATVYWPAYGDHKYQPGKTEVARRVTFVMRTTNSGGVGFWKQVGESIWSVNANTPLAAVRTMRDIFDESLARTSFALVMLALASAMALLLGVIGIYGVIAYTVSQRRREIGIRLALGAEPRVLKQMFVRQGLQLSGIGVAIGLAASAVAMRLMSSLLFGISPMDPLTYAAVALVLVTAAVLASYLPARRAATVDPVEALKSE